MTSILKSLVLLFFALLASSSFALDREYSFSLTTGGKVVNNFRSFDEVFKKAKPGDTITLPEGILNEPIYIDGFSGDGGKPLVISGHKNGTVVDVGARIKIGEESFSFVSDGCYYVNVPWLGSLNNSRIAGAVFLDDKKPIRVLYEYGAMFSAKNDDTTVWRYGSIVVLCSSEDFFSAERSVVFPVHEYGIYINNSKGLVVKNLSVINAGYAGVFIDENVSYLVVANVNISNSYRGVSTRNVYVKTETPSRIDLVGNFVSNDFFRNKYWRAGYLNGLHGEYDDAAPGRGAGIVLVANDSVIRKNIISLQWDGIRIRGENVLVTDNTLSSIQDDAVELESSYSKNIIFDANIIFNAYVGISLGSNKPGPVYVTNNIVDTRGGWLIDEKIERTGYPVKFGSDWALSTVNILLLGNRFVSDGRSIFVSKGEHRFSNIVFRSNTFQRKCVPPWGGSFGAADDGNLLLDNVFSCAQEIDYYVGDGQDSGRIGRLIE